MPPRCRLNCRLRRLLFRVVSKLDHDRDGDRICLKWLRSSALQGCSSILVHYGIYLTESHSDSTIRCLGLISSNSKNFTRSPKNTLAMAKTIMWRAAPLGRTPSSFPCRTPHFFRTRRCSIGLLLRSLFQPEEKTGVWKRRVFWLPDEF
jgi:hypothetical protein